MVAADLTELRLDAFKSFRGARAPIRPVTLIVGRDGSGKPNILDGLVVLTSCFHDGGWTVVAWDGESAPDLG